MNLTYYGQSTFLIDVLGKKILFDPFISNESTKHVDIIKIEADYIFWVMDKLIKEQIVLQ